MVLRFLEKIFTPLNPGEISIVMEPNFKFCDRNYFGCAGATIIPIHVSVHEHLAETKFGLVKTSARFLLNIFGSKLLITCNFSICYSKFELIWCFLDKPFLAIGKRCDAASI